MSDPKSLTLLAIDDNPENLELVRATLEQQDVEILTAHDPEIGFEMFLRARPRVVLLDLVMPKVNGMELLERIIAVDPGTDVILITSHYSPESAVEAIQKGASDYWTKPLDVEKLRSRIGGFIAEAEKRRKTLRLDRELLESCQFEGMVGRSPLMLEVFARIRRVAPHFRTVLVTGATGTGKELVAKALHHLSPASRGQFAVCNCSALVENLVESELFGHVRGAFTGATQDKPGLFEHANGGTIFLDEIGELSLPAQAKLLRVLQNREVQRVGSLAPRSIDVRVVAATHRDLKAMVREGQFREDLYYRLAMVEVALPSLASRREDLPLLQRYFIEKFAADYKKPIAGITRRTQTRMAAYPWPGNIRELENAIERAMVVAQEPEIREQDFAFKTQTTSSNGSSKSLEEMEKAHILRILEQCNYNQTRAAEMLDIDRVTLHHKLKKYGWSRPIEAR